jgi:hypothetical protein
MGNKKFLDTAFSIEKDPSTGNAGVISYMDFELGSPQEAIPQWGITEPGIAPQEIRLVTKTKFVELQRFQVKSTYPSEVIGDLKKYQGIDADSLLESTLDNEMNQMMLKKLYEKYNDLGEITRTSQFTKWQKFILKIFKKITFTNYIKEDRNGSEKLYNMIVIEANKIASRTRIKPGDFIVCSSLIGSLLQDHPGFSWEPSGDNKMTILNSEVVSYIGKIGGRIDVFVNANLRFNDGCVIVGRRTNTHESGVYFVHQPTEKIKLVDINPMENKIGVSKRFAFVDTHGAEKSFSKIHFTIGKKPFWRKIFNI